MDALEICASYIPGDFPETWGSDDQATLVFDWTNMQMENE